MSNKHHCNPSGASISIISRYGIGFGIALLLPRSPLHFVLIACPTESFSKCCVRLHQFRFHRNPRLLSRYSSAKVDTLLISPSSVPQYKLLVFVFPIALPIASRRLDPVAVLIYCVSYFHLQIPQVDIFCSMLISRVRISISYAGLSLLPSLAADPDVL